MDLAALPDRLHGCAQAGPVRSRRVDLLPPYDPSLSIEPAGTRAPADEDGRPGRHHCHSSLDG
jgi:hypothetical protein